MALLKLKANFSVGNGQDWDDVVLEEGKQMPAAAAGADADTLYEEL